MPSFKHQRSRWTAKCWERGCLVLLFGPLTGGCGGSHGEISGKVYYKGQLLTAPGAIVTFTDAKGGVFSTSVAPDGGYTLAKVPVGQVKIAVVVLPPRRIDQIQQKEHEAIRAGTVKVPPEEREKLFPDSPPRGLAITLPPAYADPETSGLTQTVTGGKQTYDIELR